MSIKNKLKPKMLSHTSLGVLLVILSFLFYTLHYVLFRDAHHIFIYFVGDIAFVFVEVLLVSMLLHRVLNERDRKQRIEKLNIVIGSFFSESGKYLLAEMIKRDQTDKKNLNRLITEPTWQNTDFKNAFQTAQQLSCTIKLDTEYLLDIYNHLEENHQFYLRLLENPTLLEHESFTDTLQAVFHLREELHWRKRLHRLPANDLEHLQGDIHRVYSALLLEWLHYLDYLRQNYPYLYSLALRTNPLLSDPQAGIA